jgi:branched-chain amino acid transport system substrate-binding protein
MSDQGFDLAIVQRSRPELGWVMILCGAILVNGASASPRDNLNVVRDLSSRVGPIIGSALACPNIARPSVQAIIDKF